ncbi:MAG: aminodeoxychorismate synthase component I [Balneolaceae bacterium]|nr:aminodeoxychorismate synthase component I [Balneolaceae bacterium]
MLLFRENPWDALKQFRDETKGWLFGYLGYDLKNYIESLYSQNSDPVEAPDLYMMNPGVLIEITDGDWNIIKGDIPSREVAQNTFLPDTVTVSDFKPTVDEQVYLQMIERAKQDIAEGEYYEINLTHQMSGNLRGQPLQLYQKMKKAGPVPFGAYLSFGDYFTNWNICCSSPERFLAKKGQRVFSQPIKGTVKRGTTEGEDKRLKKWLATSPKNRAENLMIVDLVRNDLGRIARKGSVRVSDLFEIQTFETVHQMVSTVQAESDDYHPVDIIRSCFPMGSMTGAPKISAMRSIEELENYRRGIYSGSIGYFSPDGNFDFNVVIRTAVIKRDKLFYSVGGAITSDSDPQSEWEETLLKARALTNTFATSSNLKK